jgi:hypothetical protein
MYYSHEMMKSKVYYEPLIPFFRFLALEQDYLDKM